MDTMDTMERDNFAIDAMCLWEAMLNKQAENVGRNELHATLRKMFEDHGHGCMRSAVIDMVEECVNAYEAPGSDSISFDWDHCPLFLDGAIASGRLQIAIDRQYQPRQP